MAFYLHDAEVVIQLDHAPSKINQKQDQNVLIQNWALEMFLIIPYITFQHIKGKDNILLFPIPTMKRQQLINIHSR